MAIHPFDNNSQVYNFLFHPLHKAKENKLKAALAVITNVALSILTCFVWQIPFWIINQLDNRKLKVLNTPLAITPSANASAPVHLAKTGRIRHGDNTCFLAAAVQLCRQIPGVRDAIGSEPTKNEWESEQQFSRRKLVHQSLKFVLERTEKGEDVSAAEMNEFNRILHECFPNAISRPGEGGDVPVTFTHLLMALSIPESKSIFEDIAEDPAREKDLTPVMLLTGGIDCLNDARPEYNYNLDGDSAKKVTYRLVGVAGYGSGHAFVHIKNVDDPSSPFILFDDLHSHKTTQTIERNSTWPAKKFFAVYMRVSP